jgi:hypothetical protein
MSLTHLGTPKEFRIQDSEARLNRLSTLIAADKNPRNITLTLWRVFKLRTERGPVARSNSASQRTHKKNGDGLNIGRCCGSQSRAPKKANDGQTFYALHFWLST